MLIITWSIAHLINKEGYAFLYLESKKWNNDNSNETKVTYVKYYRKSCGKIMINSSISGIMFDV